MKYLQGLSEERLQTILRKMKNVNAVLIGDKKVLYAPHADKRIGFARASLKTRRGPISASWRYLSDGSVRSELSLPDATTATIRLPGQAERTVTGGSYVFYTR